MSLLFMDGFNHVDVNYLNSKWDVLAGYIYFEPTYGRDEGWGLDMYSNTTSIKKYLPNTTTIIIGGAFMLSQLTSSDFLRTVVDGVKGISVQLRTDGKFYILRGTTPIANSDGELMSVDEWKFIELKVLFSNTVGTVELRLDGDVIIDEAGLDTCIDSKEYCNEIDILPNGTAAHIRIDDFYICDTTGSLNNDFLGDVTITTLYPTSDGVYADFSLQSGSDHFAMVDDEHIDDESTYVESDTVGDKETFGMTTFSGTETVCGIQVVVNSVNAEKGTMNLRTLCRSGAVPADTEGSSVIISQSPTPVISLYEKEPVDDVAWTVTSINNAEFGVKIQS